MAKNEERKSPATYAVGHGKPPIHTRFKKGQSGNPIGRRKGSRNLATVLRKTLNETVVVKENGRQKTISKLDALVKQLVNKAATGNLRALSQVSTLILTIEQSAEQSAPPRTVLNELDKKSILDFIKRCDDSNQE